MARSRLGQLGLGGAGALVAVTVLAACGSSSSSGKAKTPAGTGAGSSAATVSYGDPTLTGGKVVAAAHGAQITFALEQPPADFNNNDVNGNSFETAQILQGFLPSVSHGTVDNSYAFDTNLLSGPPTLTSTSPQTIVYHINPAAVWSDGVPVDASDFIYLWKALNGTNAKYEAASTTGYSQIKSVTGSDNGKTVTVVFSSPFSEWQGLFASVGGNFLLPAHLFAAGGPDGFNSGLANGPSYKGQYFSAGPYIVQSYKVNDSLIEVPNPKWWGPKPNFDKVVYRFIPDTTQFPAAVSNNEVDLVFPSAVTSDEAKQLEAIPRIATSYLPGAQFEHIDFNFKNKFLGDLKVRQAVAQAINIKTLIAGTVGQVAPATAPLGNHIYLPGQKAYVDHRGSYGNGNVAAAKKLLEGDGYTLGSDGYYAKDGAELSFGITAKSGNATRVNEERIMQAELKQAGINLKIANTDKSIGTFTAAHDYDIALFAWVGGPFVISGNAPIYQTAPAGGSENTQFYSNATVDKLFTEAQGELDPTKAAADVNQADAQLYADMATLPLFQKPTFLGVDKKFVNIFDNPTQDGPAANILQWGVKP